jgi:hypothetical protein
MEIGIAITTISQVAGPSVALVGWTLALVALVALVALAVYRWRRLGRERALTPLLKSAILVCVLTIVWVVPGLVAAVAVGAVALLVNAVHLARSPRA